MLKNLSEKYKFLLLTGAFLLLILISYQIALKGTVQLRREVKALKQKISEADELPQQIGLLRKQLKMLNATYFEEKQRSNNKHEIVLETVSRQAAKYAVTVYEFPARHIVSTSSVQVETHTITLRGRYTDLLKTIQSLETEERVGRIVSVNFYTESERRSRKKYLYAQLFIQNYSNTPKHEKNS
jgi:type II secretory pathway component PulJ